MSMLATAPPQPPDDLSAEVLSHLAAQLGSAERLLEIVLEQGVAIKARDVHTVVRLSGMLHGEMSRREVLEQQRSDLLHRSGERLGVPPEAVTVGRLGALMSPDAAAQATARSAQLRGLLHELQREHMCNRALMKVELSFLDHLMKTLELDSRPAYDASGAGRSRPVSDGHRSLRVLDLEA